MFKYPHHKSNNLMLYILVIIIFFVLALIYIFFLGVHRVHGESMSPKYKDGNIIFTNRLSSNVKADRGQVIFFKSSRSSHIKRVIGIGGDDITIHDGAVIINGTKLNEPYVLASSQTHGGDFLKEETKLKIPLNSYFVLGDNRDNSIDSRNFGFISSDEILGVVWGEL